MNTLFIAGLCALFAGPWDAAGADASSAVAASPVPSDGDATVELVALLDAASGPPAAHREAPAQMSLDALGREYRRLRRVADRPKRTQAELEDTEHWGGRMQKVMDELAARLGVKGTLASALEARMGPPDELVAPGAPTWIVDRKAADSTLYVYVWRHRDLLFFEVRDGAVLRSGWWMPYE